MAVTTMRMSELLTKTIDKTTTVSSAKPPQGLLLVPVVWESKTSGSERSPFFGGGSLGQESRSGSPIRTITVAHGSSAALEEMGTVAQAEGEAVELGPVAATRATPTSAPIIQLEACPSFAEQRHKPLWLERHGTLQRAYSDTLKAKAEQDGQEDCLNRVEEDDGSDDGTDSTLQVEAVSTAAGGLESYLPGWEIARSGVWLMAESALLRAEQAAARSAQDNASSGGSLETVAEDSELAAALPASGAAASTSSRVAAESSTAAGHQSGRAQARTAAPQLPLEHMATALRRARSMSRSFLATPLGLGAALAPSGPSLGSARSVYSFIAASKHSAAGPGATAAARAAPQPECDGDGRHHVAFAAGLAAATSAAAAVSQAAAVAASSVAAATSASAAASLALELGGKALAAGGGVLVDKVQNIAARHATSAVAEIVMGPSSCEVQRSQLVNRVQATVAGASILYFLFNLASMSDALAHLDFEHDFATSAKVVLDLVTSGPSLLENCKDLMHIGVAVGLRVAQRDGFET